MMRRHSIVVVVCLVTGLMVGGIWQLGREVSLLQQCRFSCPRNPPT